MQANASPCLCLALGSVAEVLQRNSPSSPVGGASLAQKLGLFQGWPFEQTCSGLLSLPSQNWALQGTWSWSGFQQICVGGGAHSCRRGGRVIFLLPMLQFCLGPSHPLVTTSRGQELQKQTNKTNNKQKPLSLALYSPSTTSFHWAGLLPSRLSPTQMCQLRTQQPGPAIGVHISRPLGKGWLVPLELGRIASLSPTLTSPCPALCPTFFWRIIDLSDSLLGSLLTSLHHSAFLLNSPSANTNQGEFPRLVLQPSTHFLPGTTQPESLQWTDYH